LKREFGDLHYLPKELGILQLAASPFIHSHQPEIARTLEQITELRRAE
jgi:hypothetical protein